MTKYIPDFSSRRWVILAPGRFSKPKATNQEYSITNNNGLKYAKECPFCLGNESLTPPEIDRIAQGNSWLVRTFSNKYPITDIHELIVHHPDHFRDIEDFDAKEMLALMQMYQKRLQALRLNGVPILFRNKGQSAGTSLPHPHSQVIVLPQQINLEALTLEPVKNIILDNAYFVLYCPDFSQYPYEIWIAHKKSQSLELSSRDQQEVRFENFSESELADLGMLLQKALRALTEILGQFDYNYYFSPNPPFYLRLIPRIMTRGGFELGTGLSTNTLDPSEAAEKLKELISPRG
jgi:UDPglucose--hexose-1-phosphate uridylyltransferase